MSRIVRLCCSCAARWATEWGALLGHAALIAGTLYSAWLFKQKDDPDDAEELA